MKAPVRLDFYTTFSIFLQRKADHLLLYRWSAKKIKIMKPLEKNKSIVYRFNKEFIENGDLSVFDEIVDPGFIYHSRLSGAPEGRQAYFDFFQFQLRLSM